MELGVVKSYDLYMQVRAGLDDARQKEAGDKIFAAVSAAGLEAELTQWRDGMAAEANAKEIKHLRELIELIKADDALPSASEETTTKLQQEVAQAQKQVQIATTKKDLDELVFYGK